MRVGFDISQLAYGGGVSTYTKNLTAKLSSFDNLEMVYFYSSLRIPYRGNLKNVKRYRVPSTLLEPLFNKARLFPIEKFIGDIDIYHSSDWLQPLTKGKKVTTYHDVIPLKFPQWSDQKIVSVHKRRLQLVEDEIDIVIAVSKATKKDLLDVSKIPEKKIKVIYEAADEIFKPQPKERIKDFRKKYKLPERFILAIGGIGERKNLERVKEAVGNYPLVITGKDLYIKDEEIPLLYSASSLLLYPSLYEGFGLPVLESMSCGTPVITSNVSSLPEIGGEAAVYVDPLDVDKIKKEVVEIMNNEILRKDLIKKGLSWVKNFSWDKCAKETIKVYKDLMEDKND